MDNLYWNIFEKTGSIEAFLYLNDLKKINEENNQSREIDSNYDNLEHPRDSS